MTLKLLELASKHPTLTAQISGTLAKSPAVLGSLLEASATQSFAPVAAAITANTNVFTAILQQVLAYIEANPQIIGEIVSLIAEFLPKG